MGRNRYLEIDLATASPEALVVRLYEAALRSARRARDLCDAGDVAGRGRALSHAMSCVAELASALDMERGGEIARNLDALYAFVNDRLLHANQVGEAKPVDEALAVLVTLHEAWVEIARRAETPVAHAS